MKYWVAVVSSPNSFHRLRSGEQNWFCINVGSAPGDLVMMYATTKASKGGGMFGVFEVVKVDETKHAFCAPYNTFGFGPPLRYVEMEKRTQFPNLVPIGKLKTIKKFRDSAAVRRLFQGTCFEVHKPQFDAAVAFCEHAPVTEC